MEYDENSYQTPTKKKRSNDSSDDEVILVKVNDNVVNQSVMKSKTLTTQQKNFLMFLEEDESETSEDYDNMECEICSGNNPSCSNCHIDTLCYVENRKENGVVTSSNFVLPTDKGDVVLGPTELGIEKQMEKLRNITRKWARK
jgi:hypothetical protein